MEAETSAVDNIEISAATTELTEDEAGSADSDSNWATSTDWPASSENDADDTTQTEDTVMSETDMEEGEKEEKKAFSNACLVKKNPQPMKLRRQTYPKIRLPCLTRVPMSP